MEAMQDLEATPLKLIPGQHGLWGLTIPGSETMLPSGAVGAWKIREVCGAHIGDRGGCIVTIDGPHGEVSEGYAFTGDHMLLVAICEALKHAASESDNAFIHYNFDQLADLIAEKAN